MAEVYRRKALRTDDSVTVAPYRPPIDRAAFGLLREVARLAAPSAEVSEIVFPSGKRALAAYWVTEDGPDYTTVEPGEYLGYSGGNRILFSTDDGDLARWYEHVPQEEPADG
jgi:hypothetical protein